MFQVDLLAPSDKRGHCVKDTITGDPPDSALITVTHGKI